MLIGLVWIGWVCLDSARPYALWMWHSQHLTSGEMIPRDDAVAQMKDLQLALRDLYRPLIIPALLMLAGGILSGIGKKRVTEQGGGEVRG